MFIVIYRADCYDSSNVGIASTIEEATFMAAHYCHVNEVSEGWFEAVQCVPGELLEASPVCLNV